MNTRLYILSAGLFITLVAPCYGIEPVAQVISQPDSPLTIISYSAQYLAGLGGYIQEGIHHEVEYDNTSQRPIVAVKIGLVSFNVWNEFLDHTGGVAIEDLAHGATKKGTWIARGYADFGFMTGVAYVNKVRFDDGTIWSADLNAIADELRKIEQSFDVSTLDGKPEK